MRLSELREGEKGVVVKVLGHGGFRKRIVEMGFIKGKVIQAVMNAPLHDPVKYRVMDYEVSLRRKEASMIEVISLEEALKQDVTPASHGSIGEDKEWTDEQLKRIALGKRRTINVALVGNPNCGKTSLFNIASGSHEHVGNYSGVTVDAKEGFFRFQGYNFRIIDLPGTYSLTAYTPEELYVRRYIIDQTPDVIINVVDAANLERNLYLTTQLVDMNQRVVVALNMYDELEKSGDQLDYKQLSVLFGIPMIPTICKKGLGIDHLFHLIINMYEGGDFFDKSGNISPEILKDLNEWHETDVHDQQSADYARHVVNEQHEIERTYRHIHINHGKVLEEAIDDIKEEIAQNEEIRHRYSTRFLAIKLLENDKDIQEVLSGLPNASQIFSIAEKAKKHVLTILNEDSESALTNAKYGFIAGALRETYVKNQRERKTLTQILDTVMMHRVWGYPIFFILLFAIFEATFVLGEYPMNWIEQMVTWISESLRTVMQPGILKDLLVDGIVGGVGGVLVFLPNILILYFCISIMEDSGYMARAAFLMDKIMHKMGLHGKSFIPLIMGFGCNVPAVMATRTLESHKSRLITMLIIPLMSCSARLPVFLLLTSAFFPTHGALVLFFIYLLSIFTAFIAARVLSRYVVKSEDSPFVMELPPYRMPTVHSIVRHTWEKGKEYLKKMGGVILFASIIIWFLGYFPQGTEDMTPQQQQEQSYIGRIGQTIEPAIAPLGFDWQMGVGLLTGIGAKELVVSTLNVLYAIEPSDAPLLTGEGSPTEGDASVGTGHTVSVNEAFVVQSTDFAFDSGVAIEDGKELLQQLPNSGNMLSLPERMNISPLVALSYMIFILFYFPCVATVVAIGRESKSWKWALFAVLYTTLLAWMASFCVFQIGSVL